MMPHASLLRIMAMIILAIGISSAEWRQRSNGYNPQSAAKLRLEIAREKAAVAALKAAKVQRFAARAGYYDDNAFDGNYLGDEYYGEDFHYDDMFYEDGDYYDDRMYDDDYIGYYEDGASDGYEDLGYYQGGGFNEYELDVDTEETDATTVQSVQNSGSCVGDPEDVHYLYFERHVEGRHNLPGWSALFGRDPGPSRSEIEKGGAVGTWQLADIHANLGTVFFKNAPCAVQKAIKEGKFTMETSPLRRAQMTGILARESLINAAVGKLSVMADPLKQSFFTVREAYSEAMFGLKWGPKASALPDQSNLPYLMKSPKNYLGDGNINTENVKKHYFGVTTVGTDGKTLPPNQGSTYLNSYTYNWYQYISNDLIDKIVDQHGFADCLWLPKKDEINKVLQWPGVGVARMKKTFEKGAVYDKKAMQTKEPTSKGNKGPNKVVFMFSHNGQFKEMVEELGKEQEDANGMKYSKRGLYNGEMVEVKLKFQKPSGAGQKPSHDGLEIVSIKQIFAPRDKSPGKLKKAEEAAKLKKAKEAAKLKG